MSTMTLEQVRNEMLEREGKYRSWIDAIDAHLTSREAKGDEKPVAWFPAYADGKILRHFSDGKAVPASTTKEHAEQVRLWHLGTSGNPVVPLYAHPATQDRNG